MSLFQGFIQLGAGLSVGLAGLAAGFAIGIVGDAGVRGSGQQPRLFVGMVSDSRGSQIRLLTLKYTDFDSDFRRSLGSLRPHRCPHYEHQGRWCLSGMSSPRPSTDPGFSFLDSATNAGGRNNNGVEISG